MFPAGSRLAVVSLDRILSRSQKANGLPPSSFCAFGAALLSVQDVEQLKLRVTQEVIISYEQRSCVVRVWPFAHVEQGYIALDNSSIDTLKIPVDSIVTRMVSKGTASSTPKKTPTSSRKSSSSKKKNKSSARSNDRIGRFESENGDRRAQNRRGFETPSPKSLQPPPVQPSFVSITQFDSSVPVLRLVEVDPPEEYMPSSTSTKGLKRSCNGRVLSKSLVLNVKVLGVGTKVTVRTLRDVHNQCVDFARVTDETSFSFGRSGHERKPNVVIPTLSQLGGIDNAANSLLATVRDFFNQSRTDEIVSHRGAIIYGPSGTGKTSLARAISREFDVHLEEIHGAAVSNLRDEAPESPGGIAAVERAFSRADMFSPSVLVLNDIESIARNRGDKGRSTETLEDAEKRNNGTSNWAYDLTRLVENLRSRVFVIGTAISVKSVDPSLRKPGRLDLEVELTIPDSQARCDVLRKVSAKARDHDKVCFNIDEGDNLARIAFGCVHADIASAWNRTVSQASLRTSGSTQINIDDLRKSLAVTSPSALREISVEVPTTRWNDVGGQELAKSRLREAVELPLNEQGRKQLDELGLTPPRGILLYGPPGCSKTLLARAVATESRANFVSVRGPELLSKWVGASEKAVRSIFERARAAAPAVIFFDEIDALASTRDGHTGASAHSRVVAQLLAEMDGIASNEGMHGERVVVIAATNRPDLLDKALLRPGRIDVQIYVGLPDCNERKAILQVHCRGTPLDDDISIEELASNEFTGGMSGAEIAALVREAALDAMREFSTEATHVKRSHFESAGSRLGRGTNNRMLSFFEQYRNLYR